jgi:flavin reductase (DIM6/NTAB) family NADH-FMN oxidoreductase RutF
VPDRFAALMGELDAPVFLVTCRPAGGEPAGCLVGFASQCSIDPPRFLACLSRANRTCAVADHADALAVHLVPPEAEALARLFGGETGDEVDKFARCAWRSGPAGAPILEDLPNWFVGRIGDRLDLGDHVGFLLVPIAACHRAGHRELGLQAAARIEPGHPA